MDIKTIIRASILMTVIVLLLTLVSTALQFLPSFIAVPDTFQLAVQYYSYLMVLAFVVLCFWTGKRAVKSYRLDAVGGGLAAAVSCLFTGLLSLVGKVVLDFLVLRDILPAQQYVSTESVIAANLLGTLTGDTGVLISGVCGIGLLGLSTLMAFFIGGVGGLFAQKRRA